MPRREGERHTRHGAEDKKGGKEERGMVGYSVYSGVERGRMRGKARQRQGVS